MTCRGRKRIPGWILGLWVGLGSGPELVAQKPSPEAIVEVGSALRSSQAPVSGRAVRSVVVPKGSRMLLRLENDLDSVNARKGDGFRAVFEREVRIGSEVVVPEGSEALGVVSRVRRAGRLVLRARVGLRLTRVRLQPGKEIPIMARKFRKKGRSTAVRTIGGTGSSALGGAVLSRGNPAGGAIGGAVVGGVLSAMKRGPEIFLDRGTLLEFTLKEDLKVPVGP